MARKTDDDVGIFFPEWFFFLIFISDLFTRGKKGPATETEMGWDCFAVAVFFEKEHLATYGIGR